MPDNPDDKSDSAKEPGEPSHPEAKGHEALPVSMGTKEAIIKFVEAKVDGLDPDPEFDNDKYFTADVEDDEYAHVNIFWKTPGSRVKQPNEVGEVVLGLKDSSARIRYRFVESPDGIQAEKISAAEWPDEGLDGNETDDSDLEITNVQAQEALKQERELGLTLVNEAEGQRLLRLLKSAKEWTTA